MISQKADRVDTGEKKPTDLQIISQLIFYYLMVFSDIVKTSSEPDLKTLPAVKQMPSLG